MSSLGSRDEEPPSFSLARDFDRFIHCLCVLDPRRGTESEFYRPTSLGRRKRNGRVVAENLPKESVRTREGMFTRSSLPRIEIGGTLESFKQGSRPTLTQPTYSGEVSVNLFNGFRDQLEDDLRRSITREKSADAKILLAEESQKSRAAFWRILHTKKKIELLKKAIKTNEVNQKAAEKRIRSGVATDSDRLEFEMRSVDLALGIGASLDAIIEPQATVDHQHEWKSELVHSESEHEF